MSPNPYEAPRNPRKQNWFDRPVTWRTLSVFALGLLAYAIVGYILFWVWFWFFVVPHAP
jgi:hypothetical protein